MILDRACVHVWNNIRRQSNRGRFADMKSSQTQLNQAKEKVLIIGGGLSGLAAARRLLLNGVDVLLVEAHAELGGRVRQLRGTPFGSLEVGAAFVHGKNSPLVPLLRGLGYGLDGSFQLDDEVYQVYQGSTCQLLPRSQISDEIHRIGELMESEIADEHVPSEDKPVKMWLTEKGVGPTGVALAEAMYGLDLAVSLAEMGLTEAILEARAWDAGSELLSKDQPFQKFIQHLGAGVPALMNWPVSKVEWSADSRACRVHGPYEQVMECSRVICTSPLSQLQRGTIRFEPELSSARMAALARSRMGNAIRIYAFFSRRFWGTCNLRLLCTDRPFPVLYELRSPADNKASDVSVSHDSGASDSFSFSHHAHAQGSTSSLQGLFCLSAFVAGAPIEQVEGKSSQQVLEMMATQLDEIFGTEKDKVPGTSSLVYGTVVDWSQVDFINGAYSGPSLGAQVGDRDIIAAPEGDVLYFAGEHTSLRLDSSMAGALDSGERAADSILDAIGTTGGN